MDHLVGFGKIGFGDPKRPESKVGERVDDSAGILRGGKYEQVQIAGRPRDAVRGQRVPADHEELNLVFEERREQISEVDV